MGDFLDGEIVAVVPELVECGAHSLVDTVEALLCQSSFDGGIAHCYWCTVFKFSFVNSVLFVRGIRIVRPYWNFGEC